jgi:hypothetical protein
MRRRSAWLLAAEGRTRRIVIALPAGVQWFTLGNFPNRLMRMNPPIWSAQFDCTFAQ